MGVYIEHSICMFINEAYSQKFTGAQLKALIGAGALLGLLMIAIDELLRLSGRMRLPPLAVGLGIYLPASTTAPVVVGAIAGHLYNRWAARQPRAETAKQLGVLLASGFIVGESLFGVLLAGVIVVANTANPLALVGDWFTPAATIIGAVAFIACVLGCYAWTARSSQ